VSERAFRDLAIGAPTDRAEAPGWRVAVLLAAAVTGGIVGTRPLVGLVAVGVLLLTGVIMAKPDWATFVAVALLYSNAAVVAHRVHGLPKPVAQAAGLLVALALVHHLGIRRRPFLIPSALPWLGLFVVVQVVGALRATDPWISLESIQDFVTDGLFLFLAFANAIRTRHVLRSSLWIVLGVGALLSAIALHQSVTGQFDSDYAGFAQIGEDALERHRLAADDEAPQPRLAGPIGDMNFFAQMLFVLVPLGLMLLFGERRWRRRIALVVLVALTSVGGALTVSRGGAVGVALALLVLTTVRYFRWRYVVIVALGIAVLLATSPRYTDRLASIGSVSEALVGAADAGELDQATMGRLGANLAAVRVFAEHPVLGVGPGVFNLHYRDQAIEAGYAVHEGTRSAHNLFLQVAAEYGIVGFAALFGAVGVTLRDLHRARRRIMSRDPELATMLAAVVAALVTYLTTGLFLSLAYERYFWFFMALGAAGISVASRTDGTRPEPSPAL
jgi:putative inorganic carbon (hco3(-)) transporter